VTYRVIVRPLGQGFSRLVIETIDPRPVVGKIVNTTWWEVDPSIRYARQNDLIWDIEIDDKIERVSLLPEPSRASTQKLRHDMRGQLIPEMWIKEFSLAYRAREAI
jgi:hypothetical protein